MSIEQTSSEAEFENSTPVELPGPDIPSLTDTPSGGTPVNFDETPDADAVMDAAFEKAFSDTELVRDDKKQEDEQTTQEKGVSENSDLPDDEMLDTKKDESIDAASHAGDELNLTDQEREIIESIGFDADEIADWPRDRVDKLIEHNKNRVDGMGSPDEKSSEDGDQRKSERADTAPEAIVQTFNKAFDELADNGFGEDLVPLKQCFEAMDEETGRLNQQVSMVESMGKVIGDVVIELGLSRLASEYPSIDKPEVRSRVMDNFNKIDLPKCAGNTPQEKVLDGLRQATKATFTNTEQSAKLALAKRTQSRLKNQPHRSKSLKSPVGAKTPARTTNQSDPYDIAFMGSALERAIEELRL